MRSVFTLLHEYEPVPGSPDIKGIGVYATRVEAEQAIPRYRHLQGFSQYPDGFRIEEHEVDRDNWANGFMRRDGKDVALG
jgi:hypothetical protein